MQAVWNEIYPWIVSGIGGFIGAALLLPTKLGEALIQFRTNKLLEAFKSEQSRELERLKEQLDHFGDRGRRSNEMEFLAIETVWRAFVKAWLSTNTSIGSMMRIPRFETMSAEEFSSFLSSSDLTERERDTLIAASDRQKEYTSILTWRMVREAGTDIYQARLTLCEQRIFMPASLTKEFGDMIDRMSGAQVERQLHLENPHIREYNFGKASTDWITDCVPAFEQMATLATFRRKNEVRGCCGRIAQGMENCKVGRI